MGTGSFPGVKRPGRGVDQPPKSIVEVKERVELYLYSRSGPSCPVLGQTLPSLLLYLTGVPLRTIDATHKVQMYSFKHSGLPINVRFGNLPALQ